MTFALHELAGVKATRGRVRTPKASPNRSRLLEFRTKCFWSAMSPRIAFSFHFDAKCTSERLAGLLLAEFENDLAVAFALRRVRDSRVYLSERISFVDFRFQQSILRHFK